MKLQLPELATWPTEGIPSPTARGLSSQSLAHPEPGQPGLSCRHACPRRPMPAETRAVPTSSTTAAGRTASSAATVFWASQGRGFRQWQVDYIEVVRADNSSALLRVHMGRHMDRRTAGGIEHDRLDLLTLSSMPKFTDRAATQRPFHLFLHSVAPAAQMLPGLRNEERQASGACRAHDQGSAGTVTAVGDVRAGPRNIASFLTQGS